MLTIMECANCGQKNQVEVQKIKLALCGTCKEKLVEDDIIPATISTDEIAAAVQTAPSNDNYENIDTSAWVSKIGDFQKQEEYVNNGFWSKMKKYASKVPFAREAVAMYYCAIDPATSFSAKVTAIGALAYWILPIDVIPDFIPIVGFADDATAIFIAYKAISKHITDEHRSKADQFFAQ